MNRGAGAVTLCLALLLAGCGRAAPLGGQGTPAATARPSPTTIASPAATASPTSKATATGQVVQMAGATVQPQARPQVELALEDLRQRLGLSDAAEIAVVSVQETEWGNTSLGCPEEGMMYAEVIVPGYLIMLEAGGKAYEYHTDKAERFVLCEGGRPVKST